MKDNTFKSDVDLAEEKLEVGTLEKVERLLEFAEELQDKCDLAEESIYRLRIIEVLAIIFITFVGGILVIQPTLTALMIGFRKGMLFAAIAASTIVSIWSIENSIRHIRYRRSRDQRPLYQIVEFLRETSGALAAKEQWSTLDRTQFQIRLSRFDIGPSSRRF